TGSLQAAVDAALPGDVLALQNRAYDERVLIGHAGTAAAPITIAGAGAGLSVLHGTVLVRSTAAFWRLQDLEVDADGSSNDGVRLEQFSHDIGLYRMRIHNDTGYGVRVGNDVGSVLIQDSEIDHFDAGTKDAHGVGIMTASGVTIRGCDIHHNSGDSIQSNTP